MRKQELSCGGVSEVVGIGVRQSLFNTVDEVELAISLALTKQLLN